MPVVRTSVGQAAANSLQLWLVSKLPASVIVYARAPEPSVVAANIRGGKTATVTIYKEGKREREPVLGSQVLESATPIPATSPQAYALLLSIGQVMQPLQLDVWATSDLDRDQTIDALDTALNVGWNVTLGPVGTTGIGWAVTADDDPVRDGCVLALSPNDGYAGLAEFAFDEPELSDDPESNSALQYRAFYTGSARGSFSRLSTGALVVNPTLVLTQKQ